VRGLLAKFLLVMVPLFLVLSVPGLGALVDHELRNQQEALAARIGNQAARVAAALGRHDVAANPLLAHDLLSPLAADRAFLCAEVRLHGSNRLLAATPAQQGCANHIKGMRLALPVGGDRAAVLVVRFSDVEIVEARKLQRSLWLSVVGLSFLIATAAAALGFRVIVGRPLARLLAAVRHATETGERKPVGKTPRDELGKVMVAFNDMMERETEHERALTEQKRAFESIVRGVPDALVLTDENRRIIVANPGVKTVFGYEPEEVKGKHTSVFFASQEEFERLGRLRFNEKSADTVPVIEARFRRKSGEEFPVEVVGASLRNPNGEVVGFIGLMRDISERKRAEAALAKAHSDLEIKVKQRTAELSTTNEQLLKEIKDRKDVERRLRLTEEHYALAMQASSEVLWEWSAETGVISTHPTAWQRLGLADRPHQSTMEEWVSVIHPDDVERYWTNLKAYLSGKTEIYVNEYRVRQTDGSYRWIHDRGLGLRNKEGVVYRMGGSFADVTQRKRIQQDLQNQTKLNRSLEEFHQVQKHESLGTLAGGIAHDFNNILSIMTGFTHLVADDLPDDSPHQSALMEVLKSGERGADLVQQILTYAQKSERKWSNVQLDVLLRDGARMLRAAIPTTIDINLDLQDGVAPVSADETQLLQIVTNLCINAGHAIGNTQGQIDVSCKEVRVGRDRPAALQKLVEAKRADSINIVKRADGSGGRLWFGHLSTGRHVRFAIEDNGCGMDWATLGRIFEPFFTTKEVGEGTGLGLAAVTGIVRDHNGAIMIDTLCDQGTRFEIYLPIAKPATGLAEVADKSLAGNESILFVEDSVRTRQSARGGLITLGYKVTTKADGASALRAVEKEPKAWDLVVTDQELPKMRGIDLAIQLRALRSDLPLIMCSSGVNEQLEMEAKAAGIQRVCATPMTGNQLAAIVREIFDARRKRRKNAA